MRGHVCLVISNYQADGLEFVHSVFIRLEKVVIMHVTLEEICCRVGDIASSSSICFTSHRSLSHLSAPGDCYDRQFR